MVRGLRFKTHVREGNYKAGAVGEDVIESVRMRAHAHVQGQASAPVFQPSAGAEGQR